MERRLRPMRADERKQVEDLVAAYARVDAAASHRWMSAAGMWASTIVALLTAGFRVLDLLPWTLVSLAVIAAIGWWTHWRGRGRPGNASWEHHRGHCAADLTEGQTEELRVRALAAIGVEATDAETAKFYLGLEDGSVLFVHHPGWTSDGTGAPQFPLSEYLIARMPRAGDIFSVGSSGAYLAPSAVRPPFTPEEHQTGTVPNHGRLLPGPLAQYGPG